MRAVGEHGDNETRRALQDKATAAESIFGDGGVRHWTALRAAWAGVNLN